MDRPSAATHPRVLLIRQLDAEGCALATIAMLCDHTYEGVKQRVEEWPDFRSRDWATEGVTFYTIDRYLAEEGYFIQRRYESWGLPLEPFAPIHYASVTQPSGRNHFVVVLDGGTVLDPLRDGFHDLSEWSKVNQLVGVVRP